MSGFSFIRNGLIQKPVGNNMANEQEDVFSVKRALSSLGRFGEEEPNGFITRRMDRSIKAFQRERGLKVDGILLPGGETEDALLAGLRNAEATVLRQTPEEDQAAPKTPPPPPRKPDCRNFEVALKNAESILEQRENALATTENALAQLEENVSRIEEEIKVIEFSKEAVEKTVSITAPVIGGLGSALIGVGSTRSALVARKLALRGAAMGVKAGDEISDRVLKAEQGRLIVLQLERDNLIRQILSMQERKKALQSNIDEAHALMIGARKPLENCVAERR